MAKALKHIDITNRPELLQIVEEATSANESVAFDRENKIVAVLRPVKPSIEKRIPQGRPTSADDPLWKLIGIGASEGSGDVSENKHKYLAEAYADLHE
ncbi:MAG: hypothetical protein M1298_04450 [Chloroflexi bacterium]|nr:hypothetical protein [Chloroflexota bacterium]